MQLPVRGVSVPIMEESEPDATVTVKHPAKKSSIFKSHYSKYNNDSTQTGKRLVFTMPTPSSQPGFPPLSFSFFWYEGIILKCKHSDPRCS